MLRISDKRYGRQARMDAKNEGDYLTTDDLNGHGRGKQILNWWPPVGVGLIWPAKKLLSVKNDRSGLGPALILPNHDPATSCDFD
jgi:hypothetical protein